MPGKGQAAPALVPRTRFKGPLGYQNVFESMTAGHHAVEDRGYDVVDVPKAAEREQRRALLAATCLIRRSLRGAAEAAPRAKVLLLGWPAALGSPTGVILAAAGVGTSAFVEKRRRGTSRKPPAAKVITRRIG